jgi:soluble lytic murein transglycosylase-like protein
MLALAGTVSRFVISGRLLPIAALGISLASFPAAGQVLVLNAGGDAAVYDGPTQFTDLGAKPLTATGPNTSSPKARRPAAHFDALNQAARVADLSPALIAAIAWRESGFRADRISRSGAVGEMQLMPKTAKALGVDAAKDEDNLRGGALYLKSLLSRYHGDLTLALAAYNAGPGVVARYGGPPPFKETQAYVAAILAKLSDVAEAAGATVGLPGVVDAEKDVR